MKSFKFRRKIIGKFLLIVFLATPVFAQEFSVGTDIVSRYIWRGSDLGDNTPSIQPTISFSASGFTAGFWGAWSTADPDALNEIDIYANYAIDLTTAGSLTLGFTDYTNPNSGTKIGNFHNWDDPEGPGAHFLEGNLIYSAPESFPIYLSFNIFFYNVENNPIYFEAGYSTSLKDVGIDLFVGGSPGESAGYYGVSKFNVINTGIKVSKEVKVTDSFSLPVFGSVILNPASEDLFLVLGFSL
jgi:Bacterial protein of unknown function (Gcw_chp)